MCGICLELEFCPFTDATHGKSMGLLNDWLQRRGPDGSLTICLQQDKTRLTLNGNVLWLQGAEPALQPMTDLTGNNLLWNGDLLAGLQVPKSQCDTEFLSQQLCSRNEDEMIELLSKVKGPWALIYHHRSRNRLYFARDVIGRHSLLWSERRGSGVGGNTDITDSGVNNDHKVYVGPCFNSNNSTSELPLSQSTDGVHLMQNSSKSTEVIASGADILDATHWKLRKTTSFVLTSVASSDKHYEEVPAFGLYYIDLNDAFEKEELSEWKLSIHLIPWNTVAKESLSELDVHIDGRIFNSPIPTALNMSLPDESIQLALIEEGHQYQSVRELSSLSCFDDCVQQLTQLLTQSVKRRLQACPSCCLNCGTRRGLGSTKLNNSLVSRSQDLTLASPDQDISQAGSSQKSPNSRSQDKSLVSCGHCRVAVLFSGGLDSAMLALLLDTCLPLHEPIDLINVAFPQKKHQQKPKKSNNHNKNKVKSLSNSDLNKAQDRSTKPVSPGEESDIIPDSENKKIESNLRAKLDASSNHLTLSSTEFGIDETTVAEPAAPVSSEFDSSSVHFDVPDRLTGRACHQQLQTLRPKRTWNFVEVNVSRGELSEWRSTRIRHLLHPLCSVLDDSIGCALWFAARGAGSLHGQSYTSPARVLLCGHGADEQLCGYSRHRAVHSRSGWAGLVAEVHMELSRLHSRNMGRDNRVMADHARAPRFPYLDEDLVSYLNSLPVWRKANLHLPRGVGEKLLLRVAAHRLGLEIAAALPKRAIQFGSRIAKMDDKREKGGHLCTRLLDPAPG